MARRLTKDYVNQYNKIILTQPLAHGRNIQQIYDKTDRGWQLTYVTNSVHHICPYDGVFRNCADCGALDEDFDVKFCIKKTQFYSTGALIERIIDCQRANLGVNFVD